MTAAEQGVHWVFFYLTDYLEPSSSQDIDLASPNIKPTYSRLRMGVIQITPESMKCKLYCRGVSCKYCTSTGWNESEQAIRGLYSSWWGFFIWLKCLRITTDLLAMARPTEIAINQFDFMQQFKRYPPPFFIIKLSSQNIKTVINLQKIHEHAFCGPPLHSSGFSYDPELIMRHKSKNFHEHNAAVSLFLQFCHTGFWDCFGIFVVRHRESHVVCF